jgi:hypothetical protein
MIGGAMEPLTTDLSGEDFVPCCLGDEDLAVGELRRRLGRRRALREFLIGEWRALGLLS